MTIKEIKKEFILSDQELKEVIEKISGDFDESAAVDLLNEIIEEAGEVSKDASTYDRILYTVRQAYMKGFETALWYSNKGVSEIFKELEKEE